jgi:hypothetical protein
VVSEQEGRLACQKRDCKYLHLQTGHIVLFVHACFPSFLLSAPVDKSQQMSDWSARPLTDRQQQYAALDAFVLVQLFGVLKDCLGPDTSQQLVQQHTKTINRVSGPSKVTLLLGTGAGGLLYQASMHGERVGHTSSSSDTAGLAAACCQTLLRSD